MTAIFFQTGNQINLYEKAQFTKAQTPHTAARKNRKDIPGQDGLYQKTQAWENRRARIA